MADQELHRIDAPASPPPKGREPLGQGLLFVAILVVLFAVLPRVLRLPASGQVGRPAASFELSVLSSPGMSPPSAESTLSLESLRGKVVILDFWASWCAPCRAQTPILQAFHSRYEGQGVVVVGINTQDELAAARETLRKHGVTYPVIRDEGDRVATAYQVERLPTLVVIGRDGRIVAIRSGLTSGADLDKIVRDAS